MQRRADGRRADELRAVRIVRRYTRNAAGSVLISAGGTRVLCTAMAQDGVPEFLENTGTGWVTAEYDMIPSATPARRVRDCQRGRRDGRSQEIQRQIGRALRAVVRRERLGERTIYVDCDVLQADGGTRTLAITGSFIALSDAVKRLRRDGVIERDPVICPVAAVSVGLVGGRALLDLCYKEDAAADVDLNIVMDGRGRIIELQGATEREAFTRADLDRMLRLGARGVRRLIAIQRRALGKR